MADQPLAEEFWEQPLERVLASVGSSERGLTNAEAAARLKRDGPNVVAPAKPFHAVVEFLRFFANPLVITLLIASGISWATGGLVEALIIIGIVLLSVALNFYQVFQAQRAVEDLRSQVALSARVVRDGAETDVPVTDLVAGDVVRLVAGSLVPADARLLSEHDLHVRESALTGESLPVEKDAADMTDGKHALSEAKNSVFMGTFVQSGIGAAVIVRTGAATEFGRIAGDLVGREPETEFDRGIKNFGFLLVRVILLLVVFVFLVNVGFHRPMLESLLFALALAVGLTPELLPVVLTVTLAKGAKRMAAKKVVVKQLAAIENFGSIEILCSDKTGTLTLGEVTLQRSVDVLCNDDDRVLEWVYLNSHFEAGMSDPLDDAILAHPHPNIDEFTKCDEIPFDFERRRLSVVVERASDGRTLITKGAAQDLFTVCSSIQIASDGIIPFTAEQQNRAEQSFLDLSQQGYRVLAVAIRSVDAKPEYSRDDERDLTLVGFAAFLDPPKEGVAETLKELADDGVRVLVMTGDNEHVTRKVCEQVGIPAEQILVGTEVDAMSDTALAYAAEHGALFARVSPQQKNRVITALKTRGWVVGFLGDGINDAPSLHAADVGISVVNGVDVARDAANIILLEKDLGVLNDGICEGRGSFANIMKYIIMGTSSNFGNMFSMAGASLFLKFLPMLPTQILLNNLLYDVSQMAIPSDRVDSELLRRPKRWRVQFIRQFMLIIGPISSIYDFLTFGALLLVFHAQEPLFHTGWFVESLATQTLVVFVIRTTGSPFKSRASRSLTLAVFAVVAAAFVLPYTPFAGLIGFTPMPPLLLLTIVGFAITYLLLVQLVKQRFYRHHELI